MYINILCIPHKQRGRYLRLLAINLLQMGIAITRRIYGTHISRENDRPETKDFCTLLFRGKERMLNAFIWHGSDYSHFVIMPEQERNPLLPFCNAVDLFL